MDPAAIAAAFLVVVLDHVLFLLSYAPMVIAWAIALWVVAFIVFWGGFIAYVILMCIFSE